MKCLRNASFKLRGTIAGSLIAAALAISPALAQETDIDCEILLCMAGAFAPAECAKAYARMIENITPWPVKPPFGVCTMVGADGAPAGELTPATAPALAFTGKTHVLWWDHRRQETEHEGTRHDWSLRSCDAANENCKMLSEGSHSSEPPVFLILSETGQALEAPLGGFSAVRSVSVEYGDHAGQLYRSDWQRY
ncbi:MAG: hypothetical protein AAF982_09330 [Pseudomonadota bacterium]